MTERDLLCAVLLLAVAELPGRLGAAILETQAVRSQHFIVLVCERAASCVQPDGPLGSSTPHPFPPQMEESSSPEFAAILTPRSWPLEDSGHVCSKVHRLTVFFFRYNFELICPVVCGFSLSGEAFHSRGVSAHPSAALAEERARAVHWTPP